MQKILPSQLPFEEGIHFYKLLCAVTRWFNNQHHLVKDFGDSIEYPDLAPGDRATLADTLFDPKKKHIEHFVKKNPLNLEKDDLALIEAWKHVVHGQFLIVDHKKEYSLFLTFDEESKKPFQGNDVVIGVKALATPFSDFFPKHVLPHIVTTYLLPWKDTLTYPSYFFTQNILFGGGMRKSITAEVKEALAKHGVVTSLPFKQDTTRDQDAEMLKHYLSTAQNREYYEEDIARLLAKRADLEPMYYSELGKVYARYHKKTLKKLGIKKMWFASASDVILTSAPKEKELHDRVAELFPTIAPDGYYVFRV